MGFPNDLAPPVENLKMIGRYAQCDWLPHIVDAIVIGCKSIGSVENASRHGHLTHGSIGASRFVDDRLYDIEQPAIGESV